MKKTNLVSAVFVLTIVFGANLGCKFFGGTQSGGDLSQTGRDMNGTTPTGDANSGKKASDEKTTAPKVEKADFTVKAEDFDKEFTKKGAKEADLQKYASKNIAVTGRVSMIVTEKKGTTQPWVTLYAPGVLAGVSCYFDDENVEQMKRLKMDKMVKVQGFKDSFIVPEVSPSLDHCVVLEADN